MNVVIDTNVILSGAFFRGYPRLILILVDKGLVTAYASEEIIAEYRKVIGGFSNNENGSFDKDLAETVVKKLNIINVTSNDVVCRDKDDDKFLNCAKDANAKYIISGDKDLLVIEQYGDISIVTAKDFYIDNFGNEQFV